jgi:predicted nucleic acid-binding protein
VTFTIAPTPVVVDASFVVAMLAEFDTSARDNWERWTAGGRLRTAPAALVPEVANALLVGKRIGSAAVQSAVVDLAESGLDLIDRGRSGLLSAIELAARRNLTVYDALYVWLAIDLDAELATRDAAVIRAALAEGVPLAGQI